MKSGIYCIKNTVTGKVYIGSAVNLRKRKNEHFSTLAAGTHANRYLQSAYDKYGLAAFEFTVLELVPDSAALTAAEQRFMDEHGAFGLGYNLRPIAASMLGFKHSDAAKAAVSKAHKGRVWSADIVAKRRAGLHAGDGIQRMREAHLGKKQSAEWVASRVAGMIATGGLERMRTARIGSKASEATKAKQSASLTGRKMSPEAVRKSSEARTGQSRPDVAQWAPEKFAMFRPEQVLQIRADRASGLTYRKLADKYDCSIGTAHFAVNGTGAFYSAI